MSIPQTFIQELLNRADIVDVVGRHVQLKKGGANFMGLCPFHGEKSPSFSVSPAKQFFHCFGCGKNGNAIGFLMEHTGASFVEAVHDLAGQFGLVVPEEQASPQDRARAAAAKAKQVTLTDVLERAAKAYQDALRSTEKAKDYFKRRGLSGQIAKDFGLGFAPEGWRNLASVFPDYADPLLVESGLVIENLEDGGEAKRYDRFRDRVIFPIRNTKGECIGFGGRVLDNSLPKYLNSPETPVFSKGRELYGLYEGRTAIRDKGYCLVTEGYMDVVALAQWGFGNAVATLGTACTSDHVQKLFRATDNVIFSFDGDKAGVRAAHKALVAAVPYASDTRSVKFLFLPEEHDPDSFIREYGAEAFEKYVFNAVPLSKFLIEAASEQCALASAEGRAKMSTQAMPLWMPLPDGALKRQLIGDIAALVQIGNHELIDLWNTKAQGVADRFARHNDQPREKTLQRMGIATREGNANNSAFRAGGFKNKWMDKAEQKARAGTMPASMAGSSRIMPVSRADQALRMILSDNAVWGKLSSEEHHLLCELPGQHGAAFNWLDHQHMEHGAQNWAALAQALQGESFEAFVQSQMNANTATGGEFNAAELRTILNTELAERLKMEEQEVLQLFVQSPENSGLRARYEALKTRRLSLQKTTPLV